MLVFSPIYGTTNQSTLPGNEKIGLSESPKHEMFGACKIEDFAVQETKFPSTPKSEILSDKNVLKVNAVYKVKVKKWYRHWYKSHGKWRYVWKHYWKYKYTRAKASSSYSTSCYRSKGKANTSDPALNSIMKSGAKYGYSHSASTASAMQRIGAGDCWAMSSYLNSKFQAAGYQSRVIQYATAYSSRHRSVQLYQNGKWKTVPYRTYGYHYFFV